MYIYPQSHIHDNRGFCAVLIGEGYSLLSFVGLSLVLSGGFALYLAMTDQLLPHDLAFLGMSYDALCAINQCRVVDFMMHDRGAFGGALIAIGVMYLWLVEFPLKQGEGWAWWTLLVSGGVGFASFLAFLEYGYLDVWHATALLILFPIYGAGLWRTASIHHRRQSSSERLEWCTVTGIGKIGLYLTGIGMVAAGATILTLGSTIVFVPQDVHFLHLHPMELDIINPRLIPLIAHDRSGFGGAILTTGITFLMSVRWGRPSRSLWQAWFLAGTIGFGCAVFVHPMAGYNDLIHLAPALAGWFAFSIGMAFTRTYYYDGIQELSRWDPVRTQHNNS
jgi:hypothetical protein